MTRVVVLDDEQNMGKVLQKLLSLEGYEVITFTNPEEALDCIRTRGAAVLLTDLRMPTMTGEDVLATIRGESLPVEVIIMTAYGTVESAMRCVRNGAYDYVSKPFDTKALIAAVQGAVKKRTTRGTALSPAAAKEAEREIVGQSPEIKAVYELIKKIAPNDSAVLIYGESGTGKELAARAIHRLSDRADKRFIAINCASIPENLIESELFGHEKGAFTGAHEQKIGLIETSDGGTLFLDEIGELPLQLQAKLLRTLQEREISRVGSVENIPVNIRVIAATNRRLEQEVEKGLFREDLYYRLNVLKVKMPPLRKRQGDIPILARHFLYQFRGRSGKENLEMSEDLLKRLEKMQWQGNVRELRNYIERLVILCDDEEITERFIDELAIFESQIPPRARASGDEVVPPHIPTSKLPEYRKARDEFEEHYIRAVLHASGGNVSEAAKKAGISRRSFYEKIEKLGIDQSEFKQS